MDLQKMIIYGESKFPSSAKVIEDGFRFSGEEYEIDVFLLGSKKQRGWAAICTRKGEEKAICESPRSTGRCYSPIGAINWMRRELDKKGIWLLPVSTAFDPSRFIQAIAYEYWQQADTLKYSENEKAIPHLRAIAYHLTQGTFPPALYRLIVSNRVFAFTDGYYRVIDMLDVGIYNEAVFNTVADAFKSLVETTPEDILTGWEEIDFIL